MDQQTMTPKPPTCDPDAPNYRSGQTLRQRLVSGMKILGPNDCWDWMRGLGADGYGRINISKVSLRAHRVSYMIHHGDPGDMVVMHTCDNPPCCNPKHLKLGTWQENSSDMIRKRRSFQWSGPKNPNAKLTWAEVRKMRSMYAGGTPARVLSKKFGMSLSYTFTILRNERWKTEAPADELERRGVK